MVENDSPDGGIEEITLGLPPEAPQPASIDEVCEVSRYLLQETRRVERTLIEADRVDTLLVETLIGFRSLLGCSEVELWVHDPVGQLTAMVRDWAFLEGALRFTPDSAEVASLYADSAGIHWVDADTAAAMKILVGKPIDERVFLIPLTEAGRVVGSLHCADPKGGLLEGEADRDLLYSLAAAIPLCLHMARASQQASELMLLDPVTHVSNRAGLERDLEREIGRSLRSEKPLSLVVITICGLEHMNNLSQRYLQEQVIRQITDKISKSLRTTDSMGRVEPMSFGVVVAEAPEERVADIAGRMQREIDRFSVDDGVGGVVEVHACAGYTTWTPVGDRSSQAGNIAHALISSATEAANCARYTDEPVRRGETVDDSAG